MTRPRLLIEEWLPAQAIGIECAREHQFMAPFPPNRRFHVWWARRPLTVSRAAILASLLPADFDRKRFERLLGFGKSGDELVRLRKIMDLGIRLGGFGVKRAFSNTLNIDDLRFAHQAMIEVWGEQPTIMDPMAGGGSIPLEASRLGLKALANELNPVACSILEATVDYPIRFGIKLTNKARNWGKRWILKCIERLSPFFPQEKFVVLDGYIFARTVPCPDTKYPSPLVPDWHLLKKNGQTHIVAEPLVDKEQGTWTIRVREIGKGAGQLRQPPMPTYDGGKGISVYTGRPFPDDYIKTIAQQGKMNWVLYAVILKTTGKQEFRPPTSTELRAIVMAEKELKVCQPKWETQGIIPTEKIPIGDKTKEPLNVGLSSWAALFSDRQLLTLGTMVDELLKFKREILITEGEEIGEAILHILSFVIDKYADYNNLLNTWESTTGVVKHVFQRHDFAFKATFSEMAACTNHSGINWALDDVIRAYDDLARLTCSENWKAVVISQGSATNLIDLSDNSIPAVIVDPPYADNVQYSELADFFYVWLKRTQGHRRPEWFSTYLCDHTQEAVVNVSRHRENGNLSAAEASKNAHAFYEQIMTNTFREAKRVLRDDGILTVMFTHKQQDAWADLFEALITAGFNINATWPVKTESEISLHQAKKNAAQSTVVLASRKREVGAGRGYFDDRMKNEIQVAARSAAIRLRNEGLIPIDQLVGAFGPAMEVFSRYDEVYTDTGERVKVAVAIQIAADAVAEWRVEQLAQRSLEGVDAESRFVLLCWDVLGAAEFRFNEAMLLGRSVGMDVNALIDAGLLSKKGENVLLQPAKDRRREEAIKNVADQLDMFGGSGRGRKKRAAKCIQAINIL